MLNELIELKREKLYELRRNLISTVRDASKAHRINITGDTGWDIVPRQGGKMGPIGGRLLSLGPSLDHSWCWAVSLSCI
jgi:hypothetical protein